MPHRDIIFQYAGGIFFHVEDTVVLNIAPRTDPNFPNITAQHAAIKHGGFRADFNVSNDGGIRGNPRAAMDAWLLSSKGQQEHVRIPFKSYSTTKAKAGESSYSPGWGRWSKRASASAGVSGITQPRRGSLMGRASFFAAGK